MEPGLLGNTSIYAFGSQGGQSDKLRHPTLGNPLKFYGSEGQRSKLHVLARALLGRQICSSCIAP